MFFWNDSGESIYLLFLLWSIADSEDEVQDYLWVCVLTSNKPPCSGFAYASAVIYMWPKGSRFKKHFSHWALSLNCRTVFCFASTP